MTAAWPIHASERVATKGSLQRSYFRPLGIWLLPCRPFHRLISSSVNQCETVGLTLPTRLPPPEFVVGHRHFIAVSSQWHRYPN